MSKTVIPVTVWRQHTPPWYHQQLRTSISQLSELPVSPFEYKVESRKKSKKAKIDLIKKN